MYNNIYNNIYNYIYNYILVKYNNTAECLTIITISHQIYRCRT